jgi:DNA invertase Pin-like site-specific DNA recombinase
VSPFKRPDLGPYLTDTPPEPWTELVAAAIDRLGRNARDLAELRSWCEDRGKRITILSPRLHWPPDEPDVTSRIVWVVLEMLAEIELRQTKKRYADTREFLRDQKSLMGKACWGFMIVGPKAQKTLAPDPSRVRHLLGMIEMAEAGESMTDIAVWLDGEGVSPAGEKGCTTWDPKSVSQVLRNEALYGVRRENGQILLRHEGVISKERWDALQAKLDSSLKRRGPTRNDPMMLTDSIYCAKCSGVMHGRRLRSRSVPQQHQERDVEIYAKAKDGLTHQTLAEQYKIRRSKSWTWTHRITTSATPN